MALRKIMLMGTISYSPSSGVIITGGASGIGAATMHALAAAGRPVAAWDIDAGKAAAVAAEVHDAYGVAALGVGLDVTDFVAYGAAIEATRASLGSIGGLVHSAGIVGAGRIDSFDEAVWHLTIATHLNAAALLVRDLTPDLVENPGSAVVLVASIAAIAAFDANPAYCAAKAAMFGLARSAAAGLGPQGVRINCVCPGFIETPMMAGSLVAGTAQFEDRAALRRMGQPSDLATAIRFLLSDDASFVTGTQLVVDGGVVSQVW